MSRRVVIFASLIAFIATAMAGGDALAQRTRDKARESDRSDIRRVQIDPVQRVINRRNHDNERRADQRALSEAVRRVERRTDGEVISAERVPYDGRDINRIKIVDSSGRVRVYVDDPRKHAAQDD
ncbi:PepSY domain-containing protein [Lysobacter sp. A289]